MEEPIPDTSGAKYKDLILETIDQLRKRKARPDLERISHMVERKHKISREETRADLEKLVKADIVMKVDYKGNTSYRNAAKWSRRYMILYGSCNPTDVSRKLYEAVLELTPPPTGEADGEAAGSCADPDVQTGVTEGGIEKWLSNKGTYGNLKEKALKSALNKEVISGRLIKLDNGKYKCGDPSSTRTTRKIPSPPQRKPKGAPSTPTSKSSTPSKRKSSGSQGPSAKRTRIKKTPGPEFECDNNNAKNPKKENEKSVTPESTPSSSGSSTCEPSPSTSGSTGQTTPEPVKAPAPPTLIQDDTRSCDYCRLTEECNRNGKPEDLLICKDCQAKAHPSCMDYSEDLARRARNSPWQCIDCKTCYICTDSGDPDAMLFCDACDKGYHMNCHEPPIKEKPTGKWVCHKCVEELGLSEEDMDTLDTQDKDADAEVKDASENQSNGDGAAGLPTPRASPVNFCVAPKVKQEVDASMNGICLPKLADTLPTVVPDASEWSIDDVVKFFKDVGFVQQAEVFREQEIDGKSLLLMKRSDVLTGLSLKLGPALKIYVHVQRLQTRGQSIF